MWYALIFISFLDISHLQFDLDREYASRRACMQQTSIEAEHLLEAINEELGSIQASVLPPPRVVYSCQYIGLRKA
jgi:hypothetical protein